MGQHQPRVDELDRMERICLELRRISRISEGAEGWPGQAAPPGRSAAGQRRPVGILGQRGADADVQTFNNPDYRKSGTPNGDRSAIAAEELLERLTRADKLTLWR